MNKVEFKKLMDDLANGWTRSDHDSVCRAFAENVHYSDPTRYTLRGLGELRQFFDAGDEVQNCQIHASVLGGNTSTSIPGAGKILSLE